MTKGMTVLAIGPGLGQSDDTARFCIGLLEGNEYAGSHRRRRVEHPLAAHRRAGPADTAADALSSSRPHPGEMARLAGISTADVQANRLEVARGFARQHGVTVVLKGARTLIAHPNGRVAVNTTGNPGMAKGGSGDLLTGMRGRPAGAVQGQTRSWRWKRPSSSTAWPPTWRCVSATSTRCWLRTAFRIFLRLFAFAPIPRTVMFGCRGCRGTRAIALRTGLGSWGDSECAPESGSREAAE